MIDLAFTLFLRGQEQSYAMGLAAVYASIRQCTKACLRLHVIVDSSVGDDLREKLSAMLKCSDQIAFYLASSLPGVEELARSLDSRFSPAIVWRLWLAEYLGSLRRCVLLDCDILFQSDIQKIWNLALGGNVLSAPLRGHPHSPALHDWLQVLPENYFRACCCLLDLEKLRFCRPFVENRREFLMESQRMCDQGLPQAGLLEQSVLNRFFSKLCPIFSAFPLLSNLALFEIQKEFYRRPFQITAFHCKIDQSSNHHLYLNLLQLPPDHKFSLRKFLPHILELFYST